jgi:acyl CoA:acetate/3-ketoacid CoA transferase
MQKKPMDTDAAAAMIRSGQTVAITGSGGGLVEPDAVFEAIERRFLASGEPADLKLVHALGLGDRAQRGTNRFAHEGMVRCVIGGHWTWSPPMQELARRNAIEAYSLPGGAITHLLREIGAGRPGLITHVGLGTFADPRLRGGRVNDAAKEDVVELLTLDGREYLRYKPFRVDVAIVRGTYADAVGNISLADEPADLDVRSVALAAHNSGGIVIAQVRETVPVGTLPPRSVAIPGALVDAVVVVPEQKQTYRNAFDPSFVSHEGKSSKRAAEGDPIKWIIARRAALELEAGATLNFGFGASALVATLISERGERDLYWTTIEQGIHGGDMLDDDLFGIAHHPLAIVDTNIQFDFYSGGGLDIAFLGMAEMDAAGNVNVSRLNGVVNGPGGFVDITQNAKKVVFCGTFDAKQSDVRIVDGKLEVRGHGRIKKLVHEVAEVTFSGEQARRRGQKVFYVTERATFRLCEDGVELVEVAPGVDIERDVLAQMEFKPVIRNVSQYKAGIIL